MADQSKKPSDKRTAAQKIADLEQAVMQLFHVNDNLTRDVMNVKDALKLLNNKVNSIQRALNAGEPLTDDVISRIMIENNVAELAEKVQGMVAQGFIEKEEQVSDNSFLVVREVDDEGKVRNPRLQFALAQLDKQYQDKFIGLKAGDSVKLKDGPIKIEVLESYKIKPPESSQLAQNPEEQPATESAPEAAPALEASSQAAP